MESVKPSVLLGRALLSILAGGLLQKKNGHIIILDVPKMIELCSIVGATFYFNSLEDWADIGYYSYVEFHQG